MGKIRNIQKWSEVVQDAQVITTAIMPIRNEERYIGACIESLLRQDYPVEQLEILLVDGMSTDKTCEIIQEYCARYPHLRLLSNPDRTTPYAINLGIRAASGHYIVLLSAHSEYADDYFSQCVAVLERTGADNVGGVVEARSRGFWGNAIALMQATKFGVGNAYYRVGAEDGYVDTVPFGTYRKELFDRIGGFDVRLTRNQDNEMNYRIRKNGGKLYLSNDIRLAYYCRDSIGSMAKMATQNGKWTVITSFLCPGTMGVRHWVPLIFVLSLLGLTLLSLLFPHSWWPYVFLAEGVCYALPTVGYSLTLSVKKGFKYFLPLMILYPVFHISYGLGSLTGFFSPVIWKKNKNENKNEKG